jgi:phosphoinositide-3-kinase regulatory subunit 4
VKQVVVSRGASRLAVFFGRQRANDVLLSHMITFLNDKTDSQLRFCFYDNIGSKGRTVRLAVDCPAGVASFVGWQCSPILRPLLEQGLGDPEEFVVARAITAMADLVAQGLLDKVATFDMLRATVPFLLHSNLWVRQATAGLVAALAGRLDTVEVQVKVGSLVAPFLRQPVVQVDRPALLLGQLREPVPRAVLEHVLRYSDVPGLLGLLEERQTARRLHRGSGLPVAYPELGPGLRQLFGRLAEAGMLPGVEEQLLGLREHLVRVGRGRGAARELAGRVDCTLLAAQKFTERLAVEGPRRGEPEPRPEEEERQEGSTEDSRPLEAPSRAALHRLVGEKRAEHSAQSARAETGTGPRRPAWRPRGQLVAHLAEHRAGATRLAPVPDTTLFASAGADGSVRVWDCAKMEGRALANKSRLTHQRGTPLDCLAASGQPQVLASAGRDGSINLFNIEKQSTVGLRQVALEEEGGPVELQWSQLAASPLLLYSTAFGSLVGWDPRKPGDALKFDGDLRQGLTTAMCLGADETWVAAATSSGAVNVWDLRFQLRVSGFLHPGRARVRRLAAGPAPGQLLVAVQGNNEVRWSPAVQVWTLFARWGCGAWRAASGRRQCGRARRRPSPPWRRRASTRCAAWRCAAPGCSPGAPTAACATGTFRPRRRAAPWGPSPPPSRRSAPAWWRGPRCWWRAPSRGRARAGRRAPGWRQR